MRRALISVLFFSQLLSASFFTVSAQLYYYQTPQSSGFTKLLFPCARTTEPEFHPLRPYPASPCDPLIPRKIPEAPLSTDPFKEYLTFTCNQPAEPQGTITFIDVVDMGNIPPYPGSTQAMTPGTLYNCGNNQVCSLRQINWTLTFDLSTILAPIISNTEVNLSEPAKVNHYLNWYLDGTIQESEQYLLNADNEADRDRIVNYSGPIKKLLSRESATEMKDTLKGVADSEVHNYITVNPSFGSSIRLNSTPDRFYFNIPFSSVEDITGELTISIHPEQPTGLDGTVILNDPTHPAELNIAAPSDSRLFFPALRNDNAQSLILASLINPLPPTPTPPPPPIDPQDENFVAQIIPLHQGRPGVVPGGADTTDVQIAREYGTSEVTRNTEVREGQPAPRPLFTPVPVNCDPLQVRSNPGDHLVGQLITANLSYYQLFRYTPRNCPGPDCTFNRPCGGQNSQCTTNSNCCWGDCEGNGQPRCTGPGPCTSFVDEFVCRGYGGCSWDSRPGRCEDYPDVELDTAFRIASFTKTPEVEKIYDTLVSGDKAVLKHFLPKQLGTIDVNLYIPRDKTQSIPAYSQANYGYTSTNVNSAQVLTGQGTSPPLIYFPHLGSLSDFFLGGTPYEAVNLQRLLRPRSTPVPLTPPGPGGTTAINCRQGLPDQTISCIPRTGFVFAADHWWNPQRGQSNADLCWNDVISTSNSAGINPVLALVIWLHETDASNYTAFTNPIEDFGIHTGPCNTPNDFTTQLNCFIQIAQTIASQCAAELANPAYDPLTVFAARFQGYNPAAPCVPESDDISFAANLRTTLGLASGSCNLSFP